MQLMQKFKDFFDKSKALKDAQYYYNETKQKAEQQREQASNFYKNQQKVLTARRDELSTKYNETWREACDHFITEMEKIQISTGIKHLYFEQAVIENYLPYRTNLEVTFENENGNFAVLFQAKNSYGDIGRIKISKGCSSKIGLANPGSIEGYAADLVLGSNKAAVNDFIRQLSDEIATMETFMQYNLKNDLQKMDRETDAMKNDVSMYEKRLANINNGLTNYSSAVNAYTKSTHNDIEQKQKEFEPEYDESLECSSAISAYEVQHIATRIAR